MLSATHILLDLSIAMRDYLNTFNNKKAGTYAIF
jgi:hypothetical protein